ncbi:MAG: PhnD/SsuA/transferrin family substrate-binding protein [Chloroflexota bacterium]|nr:PhnD/SsuA/transferrin family substrate-binding protein [Chloroflexota bacterium]
MPKRPDARRGWRGWASSPLALASAVGLIVAALFAAACSTVRPAAPSPGTEPTRIRLALPATSTPDTALAHGTPLARLIERESGLRVTISVPTSQETGVDALGAGSLDAAWLTPFAYIVARDRWGADVALGSTRDGRAIELGQIVVPADHGRPVAKQLTAPIPRDALAVRAALPPNTREALQAGLLRAAATDEGRRLLGGLLGADGLVPLTDADFDPVRQAARAMDLGPDRSVAVEVRRRS